MKNFELPLHSVANRGGDDVSLEAIVEAHRIYDGLEKSEYREEAPDLEVIVAERLFTELEGPIWQERQEDINVNRQVEKVPKCLDIALVFASGGDIDRARWLVDNMIDQGILHEPSSQHSGFFNRSDMKEEAFEQIAEAEADDRHEEVMRNLRQNR